MNDCETDVLQAGKEIESMLYYFVKRYQLYSLVDLCLTKRRMIVIFYVSNSFLIYCYLEYHPVTKRELNDFSHIMS